MRKSPKLYLIFSPILIILLSACSAKKINNSNVALLPAVRISTSFAGPARPSIKANGLLSTQDEMRLSFKTSGIVRSFSAQAGQRVRKGEVLATLQLTEVNAQFEVAEQNGAKAKRDLERGERLQADQVISLEQLQNLRTQSAIAHAALNAARFNLGYSTITAPRAGVVLRTLSEANELIPAGQPVLIFASADRGYIVRAAIADRDVVHLTIGDVATVSLDAYPDKTFPANISEIAGAAEPKSGLFTIKLLLSEKDLNLATGLVAKLNIVPATGTNHSLTYVPIAAIVEGQGDEASVFILKNGRAYKRRVRIAFLTDQKVSLLTGLQVGEQVITLGAEYLSDQDPVRLQN